MRRRNLWALWVGAAFVGSGCGGESVLGDGVGGIGSVGGTQAVVSTGGANVAETGGSGGTGAASNNYGGWGGWDDLSGCHVMTALNQSCARTGCHSAEGHYADLDFSKFENVLELIDKPATHGDINCAAAGQPFRECTPAELVPVCGVGSNVFPSTLIIDRQDIDNSWVLKKLRGEQGECGDAMPLPPGDSAANGWNDARRTCLEKFFRLWAQ
jgi:hypothetical protein